METIPMKIRALEQWRTPAGILLAFTLAVGCADGALDEHEHASTAVRETPEASLMSDNALLASELGIEVAAVERSVAFHRAFGSYLDQLFARYPDQIAATWVDPVPATRGHIRFTADIPEQVRDKLAGRDPTLGGEIELQAYGEIPLTQQIARAGMVAIALAGSGYTNFESAFDSISGRMRVRMQVRDSEVVDEPRLIATVVARVNEQLGAGIRLSNTARAMKAEDLDVTVSHGTEPLLVLQHSHGGAWLGDSGTLECTSGWIVSGPQGDGLITAGHCSRLNEYYPPNGDLEYAMTFRAEVFGPDGDAEYHTTSHVEEPIFWADASKQRITDSVKSTNTMIGNSVCVYGRSSNSRTCNHTVEAIGVSINAPGYPFDIGNLVRATNTLTVLGDSGGGWSYGNQAWGIHVGINPIFVESYFTPVQVAEAELNVSILLNWGLPESGRSGPEKIRTGE